MAESLILCIPTSIIRLRQKVEKGLSSEGTGLTSLVKKEQSIFPSLIPPFILQLYGGVV
jgi:hypothetical protein